MRNMAIFEEKPVLATTDARWSPSMRATANQSGRR
jgi:hypothetical protein